MEVDVSRGGESRVAKGVANGTQVNACILHQGGRSVAHIMDAYHRHARLLADPLKLPAEVTGVDRRALTGAKHQIVLLPGRSSQTQFQLPGPVPLQCLNAYWS